MSDIGGMKVHPEARALIERHNNALRCTVYMGEGWEREYVCRNAVSDALAQRDAATGRVAVLEGALKEAIESLEQTLRWSNGWDCTEEELLGEFRSVLSGKQR